MHNIKKEENNAILVGIDSDNEIDIHGSMEELKELAHTAGINVCGQLIQKLDRPHPATYLGKGKLEELKDQIKWDDANMVIFNDELSPAQFRRLGDALECGVVDRTMLILDIFAMGANSSDGKLQVELAQYRYRLSRLSGMGKVLSRLGGGIGTRGPGETKLETDRRHIRNRIQNLEAQLKEIAKNRETMRKKRARNEAFQAALVGYTNAGKSTIFNLFSQADVLAKDKLFATLDTTVRRIELEGGAQILLSDTVGFIEKLPHHLIQAFRATLDELRYADVLLVVIDAANPLRHMQIDVVMQTLDSLDLGETNIIAVFNKMDKDVELPLPNNIKANKIVELSAKTGQGAEGLLAAIQEIYNSSKNHMTILIPYEHGKIISYIHENCDVIKEAHEQEGIFFEIIADNEAKNKLMPYKHAFL